MSGLQGITSDRVVVTKTALASGIVESVEVTAPAVDSPMVEASAVVDGHMSIADGPVSAPMVEL